MSQKIIIDTDALINKNITINEYCVSYLINSGLDGYFQLARYNSLFPFDEACIIATEEKGLVEYSPGRNDDVVKTIYSLSATQGFSVLTENENVATWIQEWVDLWPKGIESGGYRVRPSATEALNKMRRFRIRYPEYDKDVIIKATRAYIERFAFKGYGYIKIAKYFILKDGESTLADECDAYIYGGEENVTMPIKYGEAEL
jgi:hypothetical protein